MDWSYIGRCHWGLAKLKAIYCQLNLTTIIEFCHHCGRRQPLVWHAPDSLWVQLRGDDPGPLCPKCFDNEAKKQSLLLLWRPEIHS